MELKANEIYECYAESAELHEGKQTERGTSSLSLVVEYRFPKNGGVVVTGWHCLIKKDGTPNADKSGVTEYSKLEKRYGAGFINLETFEVDNTRFNPEITVRALLKEEERDGKMRLKVDRVFDNDTRAPDRNALARRFGATLRAMSRPAAPTVSAPNAAPPKGSGTAATPSTPPKAKAAPKGSKGDAPAAPAVQPSDLNECWGIFSSLPQYKDLDDGTRTDAWWDFIDKQFGHRRQESVTPEQWGEAKAKLESMEQVPF